MFADFKIQVTEVEKFVIGESPKLNCYKKINGGHIRENQVSRVSQVTKVAK